jgi:hypothetical protein
VIIHPTRFFVVPIEEGIIGTPRNDIKIPDDNWQIERKGGAQIAVARSGSKVTMTPCGLPRQAQSPATAAPLDIPTNRPSLAASSGSFKAVIVNGDLVIKNLRTIDFRHNGLRHIFQALNRMAYNRFNSTILTAGLCSSSIY